MITPQEITEYKALKKKFPNISPDQKKKMELLERKLIKVKGPTQGALADFVKNLIGG